MPSMGPPAFVRSGGLSQAKITGAPGPGHYTKPDLWDPHWMLAGVSWEFDRRYDVTGDMRYV